MKINKLIKTGKDLWDKYGDKAVQVAKVVNNATQKKPSPNTKDVEDDKENTKDSLFGLVSSLNSGKITAEEPTLPSQTEDTDVVIPMEQEDVDNIECERGSFEDGMNRLSGAVSNVAECGFSNPEAVYDALATLTEVARDTVKFVAEQETKQVEIEAQRDVAIAQINATSALIKDYLEKTFDERSAIFAKQFECVDEALKTGNTDMLAMTLNSINSLAASSPFKNLADIGQVRQALNEGNTEWDI